MKTLILMVLVACLAGCGDGRPSAGSARGALNDVYARYREADRTASVTPKFMLAGPVATLKNIQKEAESLPVPDCLAMVKLDLTFAMIMNDSGYFSFMLFGGGDASFATAGEYFAKFETAMADPNTCK